MRATFAAAALIALGCGSAVRAQDKPSWEPVRGSGFQGVPLTLVPVGDLKKDKRPDAKDVWSGLVEGMAKDADTRKLLKKLLNCRSVEVAVLPKNADGKFRPAAPTGKSQVYLGIRLSDGEAGKDDFKGCIHGSGAHMIFHAPETRAWDDKATAWDAFKIAANEYLQRNKKGYLLHHGILFEPADLKAFELEKQVKSFLDVYKK